MLKSLLDGLGASVGAAAFAVLPSFIQQYVAGVSTCQSELTRIVGDSAKVLAPDLLAATQQRAEWCGHATQALDASAGFGRVAVFARNFDADIAHATLRVFQPAVQMSLDGVYFFLAGLIAGLIVINILVLPFRAIARRRAYFR